MIWPFRKRRVIVQPSGKFPIKPIDIHWTEAEISFMSQTIRVHGQPESDGWRNQAKIALHYFQTPRFMESIARHMEVVLNGEFRQDALVTSNHYMTGEPNWMVWIEYARPVAYAVCLAIKQRATVK